MVKRVAFTFIELIFAIVIIGLSVMSLPLMIDTNSKSIEKNLVQEAIFAASAQINQAVTADWDARSIEDGNNSYARVVDDGSCLSDTNSSRNRLKPGHILAPKHRRCIDSNNTSAALLGATTANGFVIEDYTNQGIDNDNPTSSGYKDRYTTTVAVTTNAFFGGTNNINIKMIEANISETSSGQLLTSLKAYSANIGEVDFYSRKY